MTSLVLILLSLLQTARAISERSIEMAIMAERQAERLTRLIGELLDVTRIERGTVVLSPEKIEHVALEPADQARIFDRFERAVSVWHYGGLGLYICRKIVDAHAESIRIRRTPGAGAMFTVELPCAPRVDGGARMVPS